MKIFSSGVLVRLLALGVVNQFAFLAPAADFWFDLGVATRGVMQYEVSGSSYVQLLGRHAATGPLVEPASVGPRAAFADRTYDDGYVNLDEGTLNPDAVGGPGNTWNWAYNNPSQYAALNNTLLFHKRGDVGYTTLRDLPVEGETDATGAGLQVQAGWRVLQADPWQLDFTLGFQSIWGACARLRLSSYFERISRYDVTDAYDVTTTVDPDTGFPLPQTVPGGYTGQYSVPGPVITNIPTTRTSTRVDLSTAESEVDFHFTTDLYTFTLSPRVSYAASEGLTLHLAPKLGMTYLQVDADRKESFVETTPGGARSTLGAWHDQESESAWRFTFGLTAGGDWDLGDGYYAGIYGGYEWTLNDVRLNLGPNEIRFNGSGFVAGVVLGYRY